MDYPYQPPYPMGGSDPDPQPRIVNIDERSCKDIGNGIPCGNYPARTADECEFCEWRYC